MTTFWVTFITALVVSGVLNFTIGRRRKPDCFDLVNPLTGAVFDGWRGFPTYELAARVRNLLEEMPGARAQGLVLQVVER